MIRSSQPDLANCEDRIRRIARGSGRMEEEVKFLLHNHKHFERMVGNDNNNMILIICHLPLIIIVYNVVMVI